MEIIAEFGGDFRWAVFIKDLNSIYPQVWVWRIPLGGIQ